MGTCLFLYRLETLCAWPARRSRRSNSQDNRRMYLSNRDIKWALEQGNLIIDPDEGNTATGYDTTSIDLHLGDITQVKVWDIAKFAKQHSMSGGGPELHLGKFKWGE